MVVIDEANEENGCLQVASNWREVASTLSNFTEEEKQTGHLTLPFVQGGPKHGTVKQEYIYGFNTSNMILTYFVTLPKSACRLNGQAADCKVIVDTV